MEEMEGVILVDVLRRAGIEVLSAGLEAGPVIASRGVKLLPDILLSNVSAKDFDMIVLPGGKIGSKNLAESPQVAALLRDFQESELWIGAICAAPGVLLHHGIIKPSDTFTAFPGSVPKTENYSGARLEISDKIITSIGPGSAFEFALKLVELLVGEGKAKEVRDGLHLPA